MLFPFGGFGDYDLTKTSECSTAEEKPKIIETPSLQDTYTRSVIYLDIEHASNVDIYNQNEKDAGNAQTIIKK